MEKADKWKLSDIETCVDYPILKERLTSDELAYAAYLCERHENAMPNGQGEYICGCHDPDEDGYGNVFCETGLWLESCMETEDFIEYIKTSFAFDGIFAIRNRIDEEDLEEFLLAGGWDIFDNKDDLRNRVLDSCKVCDIAHDYGFEVEDPDAVNGYVFIKRSAA